MTKISKVYLKLTAFWPLRSQTSLNPSNSLLYCNTLPKTPSPTLKPKSLLPSTSTSWLRKQSKTADTTLNKSWWKSVWLGSFLLGNSRLSQFKRRKCRKCLRWSGKSLLLCCKNSFPRRKCTSKKRRWTSKRSSTRSSGRRRRKRIKIRYSWANGWRSWGDCDLLLII